jgi:hypothetical protein
MTLGKQMSHRSPELAPINFVLVLVPYPPAIDLSVKQVIATDKDRCSRASIHHDML